MSDDIVTRLRQNFPEFDDCCIAADEIERLRKLISDYVSLWHQIDKGVSVEATKAYYDKFHEMKKAVRGE